MTDRKRGTSIRPLARVLDAIGEPAWLIAPDGRLCYLSAACESWLGVDIDELLDRSTLNTADGDADLDRLARTLAAPLEVSEQGQVHRAVQSTPMGTLPTAFAPLSVLFIALETTQGHVLALAGRSAPPPTTPDQLIASEIQRELRRWRNLLPPLARLPVALGESAAADRLRRQLLLAAATNEHLLILGPSGSGRELAAQAIHRHRSELDVAGCRKTEASGVSGVIAPPVAIIDGALMDAELLDATIAPVVHRLTESPGSPATVLLRNLEQTPLDAQSRLEQTCQRFGPNLRLIALSTADVTPLHQAGKIIDALATRLTVFAIRFDPLADRAVDIPVIAGALLERRRQQGDGSSERLNRQALDALMGYPWPENFIELDAAIRHAIRNATGPAILPNDLPLSIRSYVPADPHTPRSKSKSNSIDLDDALGKLERQLIVQAMDRADGNRAEAARILNISRARLLRKLDEVKSSGADA